MLLYSFHSKDEFVKYELMIFLKRVVITVVGAVILFACLRSRFEENVKPMIILTMSFAWFIVNLLVLAFRLTKYPQTIVMTNGVLEIRKGVQLKEVIPLNKVKKVIFCKNHVFSPHVFRLSKIVVLHYEGKSGLIFACFLGPSKTREEFAAIAWEVASRNEFAQILDLVK